MSDQIGSAATKEGVDAISDAKGKGKATAEPSDVSMGEEDSSSEEEVDDAEPVLDEPDEDNMEEIDLSNVVPSRTRGKQIDFAKANAELPADEDDDEDDDEDFEAPADEDKMEE